MTDKPLTSLQENAAKLFVEGNTQSDAYRKAGFDTSNMKQSTVHEEASRMFADSKVSARVKELQAEHKARHCFNVDKAEEEYNEARDMAKDNKLPAVMISATKNKCELFGLEPPKEEILNVKVDNMTNMEKARLIAFALAKGKRGDE